MDAREIADVARRAGFQGDALAVAVAVALAESGGNPRALNNKPPDLSYGLWQINMIGALGPARRQSLGIATNEALYDPETNARAAYGISGGGTSFAPWTTYTGGAYKEHLPEAVAGVEGKTTKGGGGGSFYDKAGQIAANIIGGAPGIAKGAISTIPGVGAVSGALSATETLAKIGGLLLRPDFWLRAGMVIGGALVLLVAVIMLNRDRIVAVGKTAARVTPTGAALSAVA